jgi:hypothetical protein
LARTKSQAGIAFAKALHSLVKARQSSGEIVVGLASPLAEDPAAGEWVSNLCTIEAAEWYNMDQASRRFHRCNVVPETICAQGSYCNAQLNMERDLMFAKTGS